MPGRGDLKRYIIIGGAFSNYPSAVMWDSMSDGGVTMSKIGADTLYGLVTVVVQVSVTGGRLGKYFLSAVDSHVGSTLIGRVSRLPCVGLQVNIPVMDYPTALPAPSPTKKPRDAGFSVVLFVLLACGLTGTRAFAPTVTSV